MPHHQRVGVRWLFQADYHGGGSLGDEPGLGKTLQAVFLVLEALVTAAQLQCLGVMRSYRRDCGDGRQMGK
ncbi:hypothetical protein AB1Y20_008388 [Prymnesium parvum]|uniref:SNF2 N-terminal domain-containing protein n=1 Tax=Prymnesium parvum TaxID=97485 RepID=A0AB34ISA0_PRYPA